MGKGEKPKSANATVKVHYEGTTIDGKVFDSSIKRGNPSEFTLSKILVKGLKEGLQLMPVGSKYKFFVPQKLAYGERKFGIIDPFSVIIYEIELLEIMNN